MKIRLKKKIGGKYIFLAQVLFKIIFFSLCVLSQIGAQTYVEINEDIEVTLGQNSKVKMYKGEIFEIKGKNKDSIVFKQNVLVNLKEKKYKVNPSLNRNYQAILDKKDSFVTKEGDKFQFDFSQLQGKVFIFYGRTKTPFDKTRISGIKASSIKDFFRIVIKGVPSMVFHKNDFNNSESTGSNDKESSLDVVSNKDSGSVHALIDSLPDTQDTMDNGRTGITTEIPKQVSIGKWIHWLTIGFLGILNFIFLYWFFQYFYKDYKKNITTLNNDLNFLKKQFDGKDLVEEYESINNINPKDIDSSTKEVREKGSILSEIEEKDSSKKEVEEKGGILSGIEEKSSPKMIVEKKDLEIIKIFNYQNFSEKFIKYNEYVNLIYYQIQTLFKLIIQETTYSDEKEILLSMFKKYETASNKPQMKRWEGIIKTISEKGIIKDAKLVNEIKNISPESTKLDLVKKRYYYEFLKNSISNIFILLEEIRNLINFIPSDKRKQKEFFEEARKSAQAKINKLLEETIDSLNIEVQYLPICDELEKYAKLVESTDKIPLTDFYSEIKKATATKEKLYIMEIISYGMKSEFEDEKTKVKV